MARALSLLVSVAILAVIYARIDAARLLAVLRDADLAWLGAGLGLVVVLTLMTSWRLRQLMPGGAALLGFGEANRLILVASVLNMVLPSKMGDIAKAYFMRERGRLSGPLALALVVFEKACDMLALLVWCVVGLLLYRDKGPLLWALTGLVGVGLLGGLALLGTPAWARAVLAVGRRLAPGGARAWLGRLGESWAAMHADVWRDPRRLALVGTTSVAIWLLHLVQIWIFTLALRAPTPFLANLALAPLALLAGLVPLTFAGVGTRDAALIVLYAPYLAAPTAAALGLLCTARYLLPALAGLPLLGRALATVRALRREAGGAEPARGLTGRGPG